MIDNERQYLCTHVYFIFAHRIRTHTNNIIKSHMFACDMEKVFNV